MRVIDGERWFEDRTPGGKGKLFRDGSCERPLAGWDMQAIDGLLRSLARIPEEHTNTNRQGKAKAMVGSAKRRRHYA